MPKPGDPDIVYANCKGRFGRFNFRTGQEKQFYVGAANMYGHNPGDLKYRFQRVSPIVVSPHDSSVVYHASQFLHRTTDEGETWTTISPDLTANEPDKQVISGAPITRDITGEEFYSTIYAVSESKLEKGLIWVGANDGPIHVTRDGGGTWADVTPPELPPGGRVQTVEPSPHRAGKAYVCVLRYQLGDPRPHILRTEDYGRTWTRLTTGANGIPADTPTRVVREDPVREGLLYAGTEFGMFVSFDDGGSWRTLQLDLPVTPVTDIVVHRNDLVLSTMGRSFWILDDISRLHQLDGRLADPEAHLFEPRPAYRTRYGGRRRTSAVAVPSYPPPGASIDYYLAGEAEGELTLEILDAEDRVVRRFTSSGRERRSALSTSAGAHRLHWDLRRGAPQPAGEAGPRRGGDRGPLVAPGNYRVRFVAGPVERTVALEVRIDPRVAADGVTREDLVAQEEFGVQVLAALRRARRLSARIRELRAGLAERNEAGEAGAERVDEVLAGVQRRLDDTDGPYPQPMLIAQLRYLAGMLDRADQRPGADAYLRLAELEGELARCAAASEKGSGR